MKIKSLLLAASRPIELSLPGFPDFFTNAFQPIPFLPKRRAYPWRFLALLAMALVVFLAWPKEATFEASLSPANFLNLVNQDREQHSLKPLKMNTRLSRAAYAKAEHMLRNSYFAHTSPQGVEPWDFIKEQSFRYSFAGENLAINYLSSYELESDFMASPPHRENLLSPLFSETGIAVVAGEFENHPAVITVQLFASPAETFVAGLEQTP